MVCRSLLVCAVVLVLVSAAVPAAAAAGENYLVMYVVGSDLESGENQATDNLRDLASSWTAEAGDVLIIYGGANKPGWDNGVAVTNIELLRKDLEDNVIGVDENAGGQPTQYVLERFAGADISEPQTLANSMAYAEEYRKLNGLANARNYLLFWNHGGGYSGFGLNELTQKMLSLNDLQTGLSAAQVRYDLIAFDACLMASLEVADALSPYSTYLLASEENVPGCGYNYLAFSRLSASPSMSTEELGKVIIEEYIAQEDQQKTLSLVRLSQTPRMVAAVNMFGDRLGEVLDDEDSLNVIGSVYQDTQGYGGTEVFSMDLYDFTSRIFQQSSEGSDLRNAAETVLRELGTYVVWSGHDGYFSAAEGISIAAPTQDLTEGIPDTVAFGRNGWYNYLSTYLANAGVSAQPHAAYTDAAKSRSLIQVTDPTGTARILADYLYQNDDGQYVIVGDVPLKENTKPVNNSVWTTVPAGTYNEPDWDGHWYVFQHANGLITPATLKYKGPAEINNQSCLIYTIEGNLTRTIHNTEVTRPSIITAVIDDTTLSVQGLSVTEKPDTIWDSRTNVWGTTTILAGDIFTPTLEMYDPDTDEVVTIISPQKITFGNTPEENLVYTQLNPDTCYWVVELDDFIDDDSFYLEEPDLTKKPVPTKSSIPLFGILAGLGIAGLISRRG